MSNLANLQFVFCTFMITIQPNVWNCENTILKRSDFKLLLPLLQYVRPYKFVFIGTIIVSILFCLLSSVRPVLIQYAFDNYIINYDADGLLYIMMCIFGLLLFEAFLQYLFIYRSNYFRNTNFSRSEKGIATNLYFFKFNLKILSCHRGKMI